MEKINIAEILKDCPSGMELDCTMWDNVVYVRIDMNSIYPICIKIMGKRTEFLTKDGCFHSELGSKCVIYPKGKTTWEGFVPPNKFKDGDILVNVLTRQPFIFKKLNNSSGCYSYCGIDSFGRFQFGSDNWTPVNSLGFATEEEKQKLFEAIKVVGYIWNPVTKTLEKLIVRKSQDNLELVSDKFDIDTLKMWIARDKDGTLALYEIEPYCPFNAWYSTNQEFYLNNNLFPEVTFENSPQQVEIKLI